MYKLFKGNEYFGVCYDDVEMAVLVMRIFEITLGCEFEIRIV